MKYLVFASLALFLLGTAMTLSNTNPAGRRSGSLAAYASALIDLGWARRLTTVEGRLGRLMREY
jgi:hypothetical protein